MAITSRQGIFDNISRGKGLTIPFVGVSESNISTAGLSGGNFVAHFFPNAVGSTVYATIQGFPTPAGMPSPTRLLQFTATAGLTGVSFALVRAYLVGTLNLAATGNQFTHDAATFPILKNQMGASSALNLFPLLVVTTATTTTAPAFIVKDSGGTAGYKNQAGSGVVGTKTFTFGNAATAVGTSMVLKLEDGDSAVQDITQIDVTIASSTGAASLYLCETYAVAASGTQLFPGIATPAFNPPSLPNIAAGTATSGTATAPLVVLGWGNTNGGIASGLIRAYVE